MNTVLLLIGRLLGNLTFRWQEFRTKYKVRNGWIEGKEIHGKSHT